MTANHDDHDDFENESPGNRKFDPAEFQKFLEQFIANPENFDAAELARAAGLGNDPAQLTQMLSQLQAAMSAGGNLQSGVNWDLALQHARQTAVAGEKPITQAQIEGLREALSIAELWLDAATTMSGLATEPKLLTRDLWVQDAMPLFKLLSEPVANRMSGALSEHMQQHAPEELSQLMESAGALMKSAGGALFGMQLGQAIGKLASQALSGGDIGLPLFAEQRAAFVPQNIGEFMADLGVDQRETLIYLSVRELAHTRLFKHSKWLREHVVTQINAYAQDISIDDSKLADLADSEALSNPEELKGILESGALIADRTPEQQRALESIETLLALVEGWVEAVTQDATKLLPKSAAIAEAVRRRRAVGGPAEQTFGTLVGLELRPRRLREATELWRVLGTELGYEQRDSLWDHPDLLPTAADIDAPTVLVNRLRGGSSGDDFDQALRDLLGE
ncbi:MAG: zinc-dependent metalloprotease [Micrococcales bacterium]